MTALSVVVAVIAGAALGVVAAALVAAAGYRLIRVARRRAAR